MSFIIKFSDKALSELAEASAWYDETQIGLGERFEYDIFKKIDLIKNNPLHYQKRKRFHEAPADAFPYLIVYQIEKKQHMITILSVFHTSRHPKKKFR